MLPEEVIESLEVLREHKGESTICGKAWSVILYRIHNRYDLKYVGDWYDQLTEEDQTEVLRYISHM